MKIVIGSVLKPLTDVRHYHKIALTLLKIPNTFISIFGRGERNIPVLKNVTFTSLVPARVTIPYRLLAPYKFLYHLLKIKPKAIIVCTHELLMPALFYKCVFQCKLIYDVQENYELNIHTNSTYNLILKSILASGVRLKEQIASRFIDRFWLAESCYQNELPFLLNRFDIFENKSIMPVNSKNVLLKEKTTIQLLYTGTVAVENGVLEAIDLTVKLHHLDNRYSILIVGCCHDKNLFENLHHLAKKHEFIDLNISTEPVSYQEIIMSIKQADLGVISYHSQVNFKDKIPTKLYEYLTAGLPFMLQKNEKWEILCSPFEAAIPLDFTDYKEEDVHYLITNKTFYSNPNAETEYLTWSSCRNQLITSFQNLLPE